MQHSIPNEYCTNKDLSVGRIASTNHSEPLSVSNEHHDCGTNGNDHIDEPDKNENMMQEGTIGDVEEYEYTNEEEYWEPASQERELKLQLTKLIGTSVIKRETLEYEII